MLSMGPNHTTSLSVPLDLTTGVFADAYADGARIHSNSWGDSQLFSRGVCWQIQEMWTNLYATIQICLY